MIVLIQKTKKLYCSVKYNSRVFIEVVCSNIRIYNDEIYSLVSKDKHNIHEHQFPQIPKKWENKKLDEKWKKLFILNKKQIFQ